MSAPSVPSVPADIVSDTPPKPVMPAEAIPQKPADALDPLTKTEGGLLDKARETLLPIVEKVQTTAKPYTDAAAIKAQQLVDRIEGTQAPDVTPGQADPARGPSPSSNEAVEKAKGCSNKSPAPFRTFTQLTHEIETRTTTESHPGFITQVQNAMARGQEKLDHLLDGQSSQPAGAHPIQTTTNSVPHPAVVADPPAAAAAPVTSAQPIAH
ncbi:hypothetical protein DB88DRAFT_509852 [Papiliotrema laurentii]|uniref:Uncharacterized protein n=1 Tax=Papiliotrema laurentii TaxID=5418 RepID=A0AAD9FR87_PAPLA|nr:hypothetical protein DB88DRAFT_509852 [Papiliotrema laurentii]